MALNKITLQQDIKQAFKDMKQADTDEEQGLNMFCDKLASALDKYVRSAQINYITGLVAPQGPVTGTFNGNLS